MEDALICQSCGMPMMKKEDFGTNADNSQNEEYCTYCFQGGKFTWEGTMDEMIEKLTLMAGKMGLTEDEARKMATENLPKLKRWEK
ncbi:MAG: zinc ribbon domain-containing protein [Candidatus Berkelbacteria bacterium]|nr:zinc ribbon domain-containing protein [Candidatus Berkelbacteria bacterium]